jgi:acetate kinase
MKVLALILRPRRLEYAGFAEHAEPVVAGAISSRDQCTDTAALRAALSRVVAEFRRAAGELPETVALRVPFGGAEFAGPVIADADVLRKLEALTPSAPLHIPASVHLARCCGQVFDEAPVVLVFETAFFAALPERERSYGLDAELMNSTGLRRYGFHGIFHEAACRDMARRACEAGGRSPQRLLSIVLEPKPEIAAVFGNRPLTVTSGATPLEGIPGETSCGELDPGIVLALSREKGWGPEQINSALTRESGLLGLVGRRVTFDELFNSDAADLAEARAVIRYRLLLACGAGIAAMSGLDGIVFSGRYADAGRRLGPWLASRIRLKGDSATPTPWACFRTPLSRLVADAAITAALDGAPIATRGLTRDRA